MMAEAVSRVLIACDTSDHSEHCVKYYFERIHKRGNQVLFVHVEDIFANAVEDSTSYFDKVEQEAKKVTELLKDKVGKLCLAAGYSDFRFLVENSRDVWHTIIKVREREGADMIVMGSKGRGLIRRTLIGSVCDSVVHHALVPVIVIRDDQKQKR